MNSKVKTGLAMAGVAIVFYLAGAFIGWPSNNAGLAGNIGKANKYSKSVVSVDADALQERLLNDSAYCNQVLTSVGYMQLHTDQFYALIEASLQKVGKANEFAQSQQALNEVKMTAKNAQNAISLFATDLEELCAGKKVRSFEQDYNNALLAFNLVSQNSRVAEVFVEEADPALGKTLAADKEALASLRNAWYKFALADAIMFRNHARLLSLQESGLLLTLDGQDGTELKSVMLLDEMPLNLRDKDGLCLSNMGENLNMLHLSNGLLNGDEKSLHMLMNGEVLNNMILLESLLSDQLGIHFVKLLSDQLGIHFVKLLSDQNDLMMNTMESLNMRVLANGSENNNLNLEGLVLSNTSQCLSNGCALLNAKLTDMESLADGASLQDMSLNLGISQQLRILNSVMLGGWFDFIKDQDQLKSII